MDFSSEEFAVILEAEYRGRYPYKISQVSVDSRSFCIPQCTVFFAMDGIHSRGADYISYMYEEGVRNFVVKQLPAETSHFEQTNFYVVNDVRLALQKLAIHHRRSLKAVLVGITGNRGKSHVKEYLYQLLSVTDNIFRSPRSYNSQIGVPLSVLLIENDCKIAIIEAAVSEKGNMEKLEPIIFPKIGIFTGAGDKYIDNFSSQRAQVDEYFTLFRHTESIICNIDQEVVKNGIAYMGLAEKIFTWSLKNSNVDLFISSIVEENSSPQLIYAYKGTEHKLTVPLATSEDVLNVIPCIAYLLLNQVSPVEIEALVTRLQPIKLQIEAKEGNNDCLVIEDSYTCDVSSFEMALDFQERHFNERLKEKVVVLFADSDYYADNIGQFIESAIRYHINRILWVGVKVLISTSQVQVLFFDDQFALQAYIRKEEPFQTASVLVHGSGRYVHDLSAVISKRSHETVMEVSLSAIRKNLKLYRDRLPYTSKLICMVKADAYGMGAIEVSKTLQDARVDYLAVALADEGKELRLNGIKTPIMVMNPEPDAINSLIDYHLEPEIFNFEILRDLVSVLSVENVSGFPIHIKLDTGMHRLGFQEEELSQLISILKKNRSILTPVSMFSHFACSDMLDMNDFTKEQTNRFLCMTDTIQSAFQHKILRHLCNTAGIERFPSAHFEMARLGLGLYGVNPINNELLNNVATLKSRILSIKTLSATETVGYGRRGILKQPSRIAAIPIGYADGLNRLLGNRRGYCLVHGEKAPYVGNICMDICMIDVTNIDCRIGDEVEVFGEQLPVSVLADILGTIPYEVFTLVSLRTKRIYTDN